MKNTVPVATAFGPPAPTPIRRKMPQPPAPVSRHRPHAKRPRPAATPKYLGRDWKHRVGGLWGGGL